MNAEQTNIIRLGKKTENTCRPIKVSLKRTQDVPLVLKKCGKLREGGVDGAATPVTLPPRYITEYRRRSGRIEHPRSVQPCRRISEAIACLLAVLLR